MTGRSRTVWQLICQ